MEKDISKISKDSLWAFDKELKNNYSFFLRAINGFVKIFPKKGCKAFSVLRKKKGEQIPCTKRTKNFMGKPGI